MVNRLLEGARFRAPQIMLDTVYGLIIMVAVSFLFKKIFKDRYMKGNKVANTYLLKKDSYYKYLKAKYVIIKKLVNALCILTILIGSVLLARPYKVSVKEEVEYNRDIILTMDVSGSMSRQNATVCDQLIQIIRSLKGDRFGIVAFDYSAVTLVPLTNDYVYLEEVLTNLKQIFSTNVRPKEGDELYDLYYAVSYGTHINGSSGASLAGDGIASALYSFTRMKEERTRVIIASTDNAYLPSYGVLDTLEASQLCKDKKVKLFSITPQTSSYTQTLKAGSELTGGKMYDASKTSITTVVKDVDSVTKTENKTIEESDYNTPEKLFIILTITFVAYMLLSKLVRV